jgi:hypothetical protein
MRRVARQQPIRRQPLQTTDAIQHPSHTESVAEYRMNEVPVSDSRNGEEFSA